MDKLKGLDLEGKLILDAGTGACGMTKYLEEWGAEVVSVDINREWQRDCRESSKKAQFVTGDLTELQFFEDNSFDYVVCNFVISALSETKDLLISPALREFHRVLKHSGLLVIIDYYPFQENKSPSPLHNVQTELWRLENSLAELLGEGHLEEYSPEVLSKELKSVGFEETDTSILLDKIPWPMDLLKEHEELILEDIERLEEDYMKEAFRKKLKEIMDRAQDQEVRSGSIYELRASI